MSSHLPVKLRGFGALGRTSLLTQRALIFPLGPLLLSLNRRTKLLAFVITSSSATDPAAKASATIIRRLLLDSSQNGLHQRRRVPCHKSWQIASCLHMAMIIQIVARASQGRRKSQTFRTRPAPAPEPRSPVDVAVQRHIGRSILKISSCKKSAPLRISSL